MTFILKVFCLLALTILSVTNAAIVPALDSKPDVIPNSYIVVLKPKISSEDFIAHRKWVADVHRDNVAKRGEGAANGGLKHVYEFDGLKGYAGTFDENTIGALAKSSDV